MSKKSANVAITSLSGSGAIVYANTSPVGGHGNNPAVELGCDHVMYSIEFSGSENGVIPTDIDFIGGYGWARTTDLSIMSAAL